MKKRKKAKKRKASRKVGLRGSTTTAGSMAASRRLDVAGDRRARGR